MQKLNAVHNARRKPNASGGGIGRRVMHPLVGWCWGWMWLDVVGFRRFRELPGTRR